jgi:hypothetical protein
MSEKSATTYTVLQMRLKLRVPPNVFLAESREAANIIASVEGLVWKIWISQEEFEAGGIYLFANREAADAYLNHPIVRAMGSDPAVASAEAQLWDVDGSLSAITRAPLREVRVQSSEPEAALAGGE